jgi:putative ABC transport system ATP-binding protein
MSGGQQQRVAIARALANLPSILLCDEPTANLDLGTGQEILDILRRLNTERGVTVICATHDHRTMDMCDRLMWIRDGMIERVANREDVHVEVGAIG